MPVPRPVRGAWSMPKPPPPPVRLRAPIYADAWRASGLRGKPPPVFMDRDPYNGLGFQPTYNRGVYLSPEVVRGMKALPTAGPTRDYQALNVLLHEYAHVNQPEVFPSRRSEPGADAWAMKNVPRVASALGLGGGGSPFYNMPRYGYPSRSWNLLYNTRNPGAFIEHGQFGR